LEKCILWRSTNEELFILVQRRDENIPVIKYITSLNGI